MRPRHSEIALGPSCDLIRQQLVARVPDRRSALLGKWHGSGEDTWVENGTPTLSVDVQAEFWINAAAVTGHFTLGILEHPEVPLIELDVRGRFYDNSLIQTFYESSDPVRRQVGVALLHLFGDGITLEVRYSAFSPMRNCLTTGVIRLHKAG